jgi:integrase
MPAHSTWNLDQTRLLTRRELATVLADLAPRAARSANVHRNLVIVRLACCCGLRVSEMAAMQLDDVVVDVARPHLPTPPVGPRLAMPMMAFSWHSLPRTPSAARRPARAVLE